MTDSVITRKVLYLNNNNYANWKVTMKWILKRDELWDVVVGIKPKTVSEYWTHANNSAMCRLLLSMEEDQLVHIRDLEMASDVWSTLQKIYELRTLDKSLFLNKYLEKEMTGSVITRKVLYLNDNNYANWKVTMKWILKRDELWDVVVGVKPEPVSEYWTKANNSAMCKLVLSVEEDQLVHIRDLEMASDAWSTLQKIYEPRTLSRKVFQMRKFFRAKFETGTMFQHITRMKDLASQLRAAGFKLDPHSEIAGLLNSLPKSYNELATSFESYDEDMLTYDVVCTKLTTEYNLRDLNGTEELCSDSVHKQHHSDLDQQRQPAISNGQGKPKKKRVCHYCGKPDHLKADCQEQKSDQAAIKTNF